MRILLASAVSAWLFSPQAPLPPPSATQPLFAAPPALRPVVLVSPEKGSSLWEPAALGLVGGVLFAALLPLRPAAAFATAGRPANGLSRRGVLAGGALSALSAGLPSPAAAEEGEVAAEAKPAETEAKVQSKVTRPSGLSYEVIKSGRAGEKPVVGDLIAVRFKCVVKANGQVIDDILDSTEPYYFRVGSGSVLPGVEEAVKLMRTGDKWQLTIPPDLGFGPKGRSASPGKPRIPNDAVLDFTLDLVAVPGKDEEILEENGIID